MTAFYRYNRGGTFVVYDVTAVNFTETAVLVVQTSAAVSLVRENVERVTLRERYEDFTEDEIGKSWRGVESDVAARML